MHAAGAVFAGGCAGALARAGVAELLPAPWATLLVNVVGSFLLGAVVTRFGGPPGAPVTRAGHLLGTGFCGALTTFSAFQVELLELRPPAAAAYAAGSLMLGYGALLLGRRL